MKKLILILFISVDIFTVTLADIVQAPAGPYRSLAIVQNEQSSDTKRVSSSVKPEISDKAQEANLIADPEWLKQRRPNIQQWTNSKNQQPSAYWENQVYAQFEAPLWLKQQQESEQKRVQHLNKQHQVNVHERVKQQRGYLNQTQYFPRFNSQPVEPLSNRNQRYFPAARGHVYGPEKIPPELYFNPSPQQPVYQARHPVYQRQPMWK